MHRQHDTPHLRQTTILTLIGALAALSIGNQLLQPFSAIKEYASESETSLQQDLLHASLIYFKMLGVGLTSYLGGRAGYQFSTQGLSFFSRFINTANHAQAEWSTEARPLPPTENTTPYSSL